MKKIYGILIFSLLSAMGCFAQDSTLFDPLLHPFYHGVASGDPLADQVIIWTRVTPDTMGIPLTVNWQVATDTGMTQVVTSGTATTDATVDYTVKVDVTGLSPQTTYYYMFTTAGRNSLIGRTQTTPDAGDSPDHLRFAVVSCSNYESGFFNAYGRIADRNDLDAVIHLGDYFYEYPSRAFSDTTLVDSTLRVVDSLEAVTLDQYRARYALYRLDTDLRRLHQQHPIICVWDDHESANNSYTDGAQNHSPATEGSWEIRKAASKKAWYEWIPAREQALPVIYRSFRFGDLADLIMLDTRLEGRNMQINDVNNPALYDSARTLLGPTQRTWLMNQLDTSRAQWKLIGNQVLFSELHVGWIARFDSSQTPDGVESQFLDSWDGYPEERASVMQKLESDSIDNVVFLTGDIHTALGFDVADSVVDPANDWAALPNNYDPLTGAGSVAVEFVSPSITSPNFDELFGDFVSAFVEGQINGPIFQLGNVPNPHLKFADLDQNGYVLVDVKPDSVQGNWYFMDRIDKPSLVEIWEESWYTRNGNNHLMQAQASSSPKVQQQTPAPALPPNPATPLEDAFRELAIFSIYPNPVAQTGTLVYALKKAQPVSIHLINMQGQTVANFVHKFHQPGTYRLLFDTTDLPAGIYTVMLQHASGAITQKISVSK